MNTILYLLPLWAPFITYLFMQDGLQAVKVEAEARDRGLLK